VITKPKVGDDPFLVLCFTERVDPLPALSVRAGRRFGALKHSSALQQALDAGWISPPSQIQRAPVLRTSHTTSRI
jgi:hypothetical protein